VNNSAWLWRVPGHFLDEPTSALDPAAIRAVETAVLEFHQRGTRIVMTTHDLHQARRLAGDVLFLAGGKLREHSPAESFFSSPVSREAQAFIAGELVE
jgi:tungstate transport system ATP-binding protein